MTLVECAHGGDQRHRSRERGPCPRQFFTRTNDLEVGQFENSSNDMLQSGRPSRFGRRDHYTRAKHVQDSVGIAVHRVTAMLAVQIIPKLMLII